jgi:hypothetical protein
MKVAAASVPASQSAARKTSAERWQQQPAWRRVLNRLRPLSAAWWLEQAKAFAVCEGGFTPVSEVSEETLEELASDLKALLVSKCHLQVGPSHVVGAATGLRHNGIHPCQPCRRAP